MWCILFLGLKTLCYGRSEILIVAVPRICRNRFRNRFVKLSCRTVDVFNFKNIRYGCGIFLLLYSDCDGY